MINNKSPGIYCIENTIECAFYIGSSKNCHVRWSQHKTELRAQNHCNRYLQAAWNKYEEEAFKFYVLEFCNEEQLYALEQIHLDRMQTQSGIHFYNLSPIAKGSKMSQEARDKLSQLMKGNKNTLGFLHSEKTIQAMRDSRIGVPKPASSKENYKQAALKREAWRKSIPELPYVEPDWLKGWANEKR